MARHGSAQLGQVEMSSVMVVVSMEMGSRAAVVDHVLITAERLGLIPASPTAKPSEKCNNLTPRKQLGLFRSILICGTTGRNMMIP